MCYRCGYGAGGFEKLFRDLNGGSLRMEELVILKGEQAPPESVHIRDEVMRVIYAETPTLATLKPYPLPELCIALTPENRKKPRVRKGMHYLLKTRGIHERLLDTHDIRYCYGGKYENRLIFPVYQGGEIVYWHNRLCGGWSIKSMNPPNMDGYHSKYTSILNYDNLEGARVVSIVEGPMDMLAHKHAGALGGKSLSDTQANLLVALAKTGTEEFVVSLDSDALKDAEKIYDRLLGRVPKVTILPLTHGDPDDRRDELPELMETRRELRVTDRVRGRLNRL